MMNEAKFNAIPENERMNRVLEGVAYYPNVHSPNMGAVKRFNGLPFFQVVLGLDKESELEKAKEWGLKILEPTEEIPYKHVKIKRKVKPEKTADDVKPEVVDSMQNPVPETVLIGNGSRVMVKFITYWYENHGGGVGNVLMKVQIRDLVPYQPDGDFANDAEGFTISSSSTPTASTAAAVKTAEPVLDSLEDEIPF
jgi:hypothetical protein